MLSRVCQQVRIALCSWGFPDFRSLLEGFSYIVVIGGVPAYFYQQVQQDEARRVANTLEYIRLYQGERITSSREQLALSWFRYSNSLGAINAQGISSAMLDHMVRSMIDASIERDDKENLRRALLVLNDFYNQLAVCIESESCDLTSARTYFAGEATQLSELYGGWFEHTRSTLSIPDLGAGIEMLQRQPTESSWLDKVF